MRTYKIRFATDSKNDLKVEAATIEVNDGTLLFRSESNTDYRIIAAVPIDQLLSVVEQPPNDQP